MSSISSSNAYSESSISPQNKETTPYVLSSPNLEREDSDEPEFSINSLDGIVLYIYIYIEKLNSNQNMNNYEFKPNKCSLDNPSSRSARMRKEEKKRRKYPKGERKLSKGIPCIMTYNKEEKDIDILTPPSGSQGSSRKWSGESNNRNLRRKQRKQEEWKHYPHNRIASPTLLSPTSPGIVSFINSKEKPFVDVRNSFTWKSQLHLTKYNQSPS